MGDYGTDYRIIDRKNNKWQFDHDNGRLISMTDSNGNTLNITYSNDKISTITDPSGRSIILEYSQSGQLQDVIDTDNRKTTFVYADNQLTAITYPDGQSSAYDYNNSGENVLNSVTNYDNYRAAIDYYSSVGGCGDNLYKVQKVQEYGTDGTSGNSYELTYTGNTTTLTDAQNRKQELMFNNSGNVTNVQNDDGSAQFTSYYPNSYALPNKVKQQSKLQSTVQNLLKNQSLEQTIGTEWASDIWGGASHTASIVTTRHSGSKGMKFVSTNASGGSGYAQYVTLSAGKTYTFSAYVKTDSVSPGSGGAKLFIVYPNSNAASTRVITGTNDWQRIAVTFTVPGSSGSSSIRVEAALSDATGTAYFDDFQLEEGTCNRYNYLENGDFTSYDSSNNPSYWTKSSYCTNSDIVTTDNGTDHPQKLDNKVFIINGDVTKTKTLSKTITWPSMPTGTIIVFGGWAKADSAPMYSDIRVFDIELTMGGSVTKLNFNPSCKDWQYVTGMAAATGASATISLNYSNNYNAVMFDGIQLYIEDYGNSYTHDSNGNLTSVVDLANNNHTFTYTGNDITTYQDGNGNSYQCAYDDNHNLIEVDSPTQAKQNFTYDSNGNRISETNGYYAVTYANTGYTPNGNYAAAVIDPLSNTVSYNHNDKNGNLDVANDAKNNAVYYQYDYLGRLTNTYGTGKDMPVEVFNFENQTTMGSNGTKPTIDNPSYTTDSNNHYVLNDSAGVTQHVEYTLGANQTSGTMLLWFNPNQAGMGTKRYLISNDDANNTPFRLCLDTDNRLKLETKYGTAISLKYSWSAGNGYASTANTWYFGGVSWRLLGTGLQYTLYLNDTLCSGTVNQINDFTGATTTLGQSKAESSKLNGLIDQLVYSNNQLAPSDINQSSTGIYQQGRGSYAVKTMECFPLNQTATGSR